MQALILATGENKKLRPITDQIPSPLIPITNQPVMQYGIELLARAGIKDIVIALHHLPGSVEAYFGEGRRWGVNLQYILQRDSLGDAGSLRWAKGLLNDTFLVLPADEIIDLDIQGVIDHHQQHKPLLTMVTHGRGPKQRKIELNGEFSRYRTGIFVCEPAVLDLIPARTRYSMFKDLLPQMPEESISVYEHHGYWNTLYNFQDFNHATKTFFDSASIHMQPEMAATTPEETVIRYPSIPAHYMGNRVWVGRSNSIHPTAKIIPPIVIGDNCQIGREVELGPYTVIGSNVIIDDEATITESTINNHTYIGQLVQINNRFVDKNIMVDLDSSQSIQVVDRFLLGEATPSLINSGVRRVLDVMMASGLIVGQFPIFLILGLITWLTTGKLIQEETRYGVPPYALATGKYKTPQAIRLHRFNTFGRNGKETSIGRWLRRWQLNRLPELFDVLTGRIGFVGVKPLRQEEMDNISEEWQKKRFEFNVGLTGLWYSKLERNAQLDEILIADVYYVATRSWRGDVKLMLQTPIHWWRQARQ